MPFKFSSRGDYSKLERYLKEKGSNSKTDAILNRYGERGVRALMNATPVRTGLTARSWHYTILHGKHGSSLSWYNSNLVGTTPVVILIQYGHGTGSGGYVQGIDFINPALKPIFAALADELWKEVSK